MGQVNYRQIVSDVMREARTIAGNANGLAVELQDSGVGPDDSLYSKNAISSWIVGRSMPPADVLLAAAALADISLDRAIDTEATHDIPPGDQLEAIHRLQLVLSDTQDECRAQKKEVARLEAMIIDLYIRIGVQYPQAEERSTKDIDAMRSDREA